MTSYLLSPPGGCWMPWWPRPSWRGCSSPPGPQSSAPPWRWTGTGCWLSGWCPPAASPSPSPGRGKYLLNFWVIYHTAAWNLWSLAPPLCLLPNPLLEDLNLGIKLFLSPSSSFSTFLFLWLGSGLNLGEKPVLLLLSWSLATSLLLLISLLLLLLSSLISSGGPSEASSLKSCSVIAVDASSVVDVLAVVVVGVVVSFNTFSKIANEFLLLGLCFAIFPISGSSLCMLLLTISSLSSIIASVPSFGILWITNSS